MFVATHFSKLRSRRAGFTLLELLVVIVIIGLVLNFGSHDAGSFPLLFPADVSSIGDNYIRCKSCGWHLPPSSLTFRQSSFTLGLRVRNGCVRRVPVPGH